MCKPYYAWKFFGLLPRLLVTVSAQGRNSSGNFLRRQRDDDDNERPATSPTAKRFSSSFSSFYAASELERRFFAFGGGEKLELAQRVWASRTSYARAGERWTRVCIWNLSPPPLPNLIGQ